MNATIDRILDFAADRIEAGVSVAICMLVETKGSTPAAAGAMMVVDDVAQMMGTIGGGCVEAEVRRRAMALLAERRSGILSFQLDHDFGWDDGLICGGRIDVAVAPLTDAGELRQIAQSHRNREKAELTITVEQDDGKQLQFVLDIEPRPRLLIAGAGHVGQALARSALDLEFDVSAFDDRVDLLKRFVPDPARRVVGDIAKTINAEPIDDQTYIVIVTRGHRHDEQVLHVVADKPARYIGMIGSRRKVKLIFDDLRELGVSEAALSRVRAPIGIDIHSVSVSEIALSIAAELVSVRRKNYRSPVRGPLKVSTAVAAPPS